MEKQIDDAENIKKNPRCDPRGDKRDALVHEAIRVGQDVEDLF